jgi:hypothetical protein
MVVQAINSFEGGTGDVGANDIVLLTAGGGVGNNTAGCRYQYGTTWYAVRSYAPTRSFS